MNSFCNVKIEVLNFENMQLSFVKRQIFDWAFSDQLDLQSVRKKICFTLEKI